MPAKRIIIAFLFLPVWGINKVLNLNPEWTEVIYSNTIYKIISLLLRYAFGWIPFSVGDLLYTFAILLIIRWLLSNWRRAYKDFKNWGIQILTVYSIVYTAFHCFWAFNYYRQPLYKNLNIGKEYSTAQLISITKQLVQSANKAHQIVQEVDSLKVTVPYKKGEILKMTDQGFEVLKKDYPELNYHPVSLKASIYSLPLTYMGFSGYLNPFTNEAQVDILIPKYQLPTTASHEVAHQLGFAAENEANFIGMLANMHHPDPYFNYSAQVFALRYCLNELYLRSPEEYDLLKNTIRTGIFKNYKESRDFWNAYTNPMEPIFKTTYDGFLKANNQTMGIESYNYVVALIVNYYTSKAL